MARRHRARARNYKQTNVNTYDLGDAGAQVKIARISKIDAQGVSAYLSNVVCTVMAQDTEASDMGYTMYLTTEATFSNDTVITARGIHGAGTASLSAKRFIKENTDVPESNLGYIYVFAEQSNSLLDEEARICLETWGRFIEVTTY